MDTFFLQEDRSQLPYDQNNECCEEFNQNQCENVFGIKFKENMFDEPWSFNPELPKQVPQAEIFQQVEDSCASEQTTETPTVAKPVEHPPCRCYRINCQKKYCECFRNGRKCTKRCICIDCHNQPVVTRLKVNVEQLWQVSYMFNTISRKC